MKTKTLSRMDTALLTPAITDAFRKLSPMTQMKTPVILVVYVGSIFERSLCRIYPRHLAVVVDHCAVCQLCRRAGRRTQQGTRDLLDWLIVAIAVNPGETFLDRMIAMVEGAKRGKTPNEIALPILLVAPASVFLLAAVA